MEMRGPRLLILLGALIVVGSGAGVAVLSRMSDMRSAGRTSAVSTPTLLHERAAFEDTIGSSVPIPNPAAQKAGPPDPDTIKSATRSAEDAAKAAADLAASVSNPTN